MKNNILDWLQSFYLSLCDGDWEHTYGLKIDTLDNPGWMFEFDLTETYLESRAFESVKIKRSEHDWIHCHVKEKKFMIACGPKNLTEGITTFKEWVEGF